MSISRQAVEELSSNHGEPEWLRARRRSAFDVYERLGMPDRHDEEWRRTDLKGLDLEAFAPFESADGAAPADPIADTSGVLRQRGSEPGKVELDPELARLGVLFMPIGQAVLEHPDLIKQRLFKDLEPGRDKFRALHEALFSGGTFLYVPEGVTIAKPLVGQFWSSGGGAAILPHTLVVAGRGSRFAYLDEFLSPDLDRPAIASGSAEIFGGEGSDVSYIALQRWGRHAWHFADQRAHVGRDASVHVINVGLGGTFSKTRVEAILEGPGGSAELKALYFGSGDQFFDYHTLQDHRSPQATSDLLFKGALRDSARAVYAGLIKIAPGAYASDAYQANRNLLLSEKATASSIPMLEIENNDVRCTHGATVAPVDPFHLFYLESRGIPKDTALRMLVAGFFGEVLERIPVEQARALVERELAERIGG